MIKTILKTLAMLLISVYTIPSAADSKPGSFVSHQNEMFGCIQEAIYFEGRDQPIIGQLAIGLVIVNRWMSERYPDNVCEVVHQKHQFSYYYDGKEEVVDDLGAWKLAGEMAEQVLDPNIFDFTDGSLFYHATWLKRLPKWAKSDKITTTVTIYQHQFYKYKLIEEK